MERITGSGSRKITIPLMKPIFLFAFVTDVISSFKIYTEPNVMMVETGTIPVDAQPVMNIITNQYQRRKFRYGLGGRLDSVSDYPGRFSGTAVFDEE